MDELLLARVLKTVSDKFAVDTPYGIKLAKSRKKIKCGEQPVVGDFVQVSISGDEAMIEKVSLRKNHLIRPSVANVDQIIVVVAKEPAVDYGVVDKLIINAKRQNLDIILCINKTDLKGARQLLEDLTFEYGEDVTDIVTVSAAQGECSQLLPHLKGKLSAFAGQSAVGKSTLSNYLLGQDVQAIGALSVKTARGKNTTTGAELFALSIGGYIVDTPGFSLIDVHGVECAELSLYYNRYAELSPQCRFRMCSHTTEPDCEVLRQVEAGKLSKARYERYAQLYAQLKKIKTYDKKL